MGCVDSSAIICRVEMAHSVSPSEYTVGDYQIKWGAFRLIMLHHSQGPIHYVVGELPALLCKSDGAPFAFPCSLAH